MLINALDYAVTNREKILKSINEIQSKEFFDRASRSWRNYSPNKRSAMIIGIDSSWNYITYLGFYLFAVEAVAMNQEGEFQVEPIYEVGLGSLVLEEGGILIHDPRLELESKGLEFEYLLAKEGSDSSDLVLIDGSLLARFYDRRVKRSIGFYEYASDLINNGNILFISKTSSSNSILGGNIGDIYYFNRASLKSGYSEPYYDKIGITVFYARLADYTPCLRFEVPGKLDDDEIRYFIDAIYTNCVSGYPYVLRLAHESCKVSDKDMDKLSNALGLEIEMGGREVIGE